MTRELWSRLACFIALVALLLATGVLSAITGEGL